MQHHPHSIDKGAEAKENQWSDLPKATRLEHDSVRMMLQNPTIFSHSTTCCWYFLNAGQNWMPTMHRALRDYNQHNRDYNQHNRDFAQESSV